MLGTLPVEIIILIAQRLNPGHALRVAKCSKRLFVAVVPLIWRAPKLPPLASRNSWLRFLDTVAASAYFEDLVSTVSFPPFTNETHPLGKYASWIQNIDDLGLFVGGEDVADDSNDNACAYAFSDSNKNIQNLERKDSKLDETVVGDLSSEIESLTLANQELEGGTTLPSRVRRMHLLKPDSLQYLNQFPENSLHYGLALLLTHCKNIRSVVLQLPLPPENMPYPLQLALLPNLNKLKISTKITNIVLETIFTSKNNQPLSNLQSLIFDRPEITDEVIDILLKSISRESLRTLVLAHRQPTKINRYHPQVFQQVRRRFVKPPEAKITFLGVLPLLDGFPLLTCLDISAVFAPPIKIYDPESETPSNIVLETLANLKHLQSLCLSLSSVVGITVLEISRVLLPQLTDLNKLTLKATTGTDDYTSDLAVEEEELMDLPRFWNAAKTNSAIKKHLTLIGLDFIKGGEGVMRSYYGCFGGDMGMSADFRMRWDGCHGHNVALTIENW